MEAKISIELSEKNIADYIHSSSGLDKIKKELVAKLDEFDMWIAMIKYGTASDKFKKSKSYKVFKKLGLDISVPQSSKELLKSVENVDKDGIAFRKGCMDLVKAHNEYLSYSVTADDKNYDLPSYLLILQKYQSDWFT
jgi:hypothetical protein